MYGEKYAALLIQNEGKAAEEKMMHALRHADLFSLCYAYKSRVKPEQKLLEKKGRKQKIKPDYQLRHITDVVGIRLVTLFRDHMPEVFSKLVGIILHEDTLSPNPFKKGHLEEVIVSAIPAGTVTMVKT